MLDLVKGFFDRMTKSDSSDEAGEGRDIRVAVCALFLEMAEIDGKFKDSEKASILSALKDRYSLTDEKASALLVAAREELEGSIDLWHFARLVNKNYSRNEKVEIIETIWDIAYTDGKLDKHEDYLLHKLANLLRLSQDELIAAKLRALERKA